MSCDSGFMRRFLLCALLFAAGCKNSVEGVAHAANNFPDYGTILNLAGTAILGSAGGYTAGTTIQASGATRLGLFVKLVLASSPGINAGVNVQFYCGYSAATDINIPVTWVNQSAPTLALTHTLPGSAGATTWYLLETGAITVCKAGMEIQAVSANTNAGATGDSVTVSGFGF